LRTYINSKELYGKALLFTNYWQMKIEGNVLMIAIERKKAIDYIPFVF
jgi:hypothetical protein